MRTALIAIVLMMAGCSAPTADRSTADRMTDAGARVVGRAPTRAERDACLQRGGRVGSGGFFGSFQCVTPYADAGKRCTDGDQCLGDCRKEGSLPPPPAPGQPVVVEPDSPSHSATEGVCQADSDGFGCFTNIENGKAEPTLCVD